MDSSQQKFEFTPENLEKYKELLTRYDDVRSALLPVLHLAQEQHGFLPSYVVSYISDLMDLPAVKIQEVISFYDMFYDQPTARHIVQVCTNITCSLYGGREIHQGLLKKYNVENMQPTRDGRLFFQKMECLGACERGACIRIDNDYFGPVDLKKAEELVEVLP